MKIYISILLLVLTLLKSSVSWAGGWVNEGERLTFDVSWSFISVGEAELLFRPGEEKYKIIGRAWTGDSVNSVYNLLDRIQISGALNDNQSFLTDSYTAKLNENDYRAHKTVLYYRDKLKAQYTNIHAGLKTVESTIEAQSRDMISALYHIRSLKGDLKVGNVYTLPIFELDKPYTLHMNVKKKEKIDTIFGEVETFRIQPVLKDISGKDKKKRNKLSIWVTADGRYIPVKIEIALRFGAFRAILTKSGTMDSVSNAPDYLPEDGVIEIKKGKKRSYVNNLAD